MSLWLADAESNYDTLEAEPDYVDWSAPDRRTTGKSEQRERGSTASSRSPDRRATQSAGKTFNIDQDSKGSFLWRKPDQSFTCSIGTAKKNTKFGGMRSYITYPLTASHTNIQVRLASSGEQRNTDDAGLPRVPPLRVGSGQAQGEIRDGDGGASIARKTGKHPRT